MFLKNFLLTSAVCALSMPTYIVAMHNARLHERHPVLARMLSACGLYNRWNGQAITQGLQRAPLSILVAKNRVEQSYYHKVAQPTITTHKDMQRIIQAYERRCPLFLISERASQDGFFDRHIFPKRRALFEEKVVSSLVTAYSRLSDPAGYVTYTSFWSGGLFQELVILAKLIECLKGCKLIINVIDGLMYNNYFAECAMVATNPEIIRNKPVNLRLIEGSVELTQESKSGLELYALFQQFLRVLHTIDPSADILLFVHKDVYSYLAYREHNNFNYPDVVSAIDIVREDSNKLLSVEQYALLCTQTMQRNQNAITILMANDNGEPRLCTLQAPYTDLNPTFIELT
jgi:hypothetical protein